MTISQTPTGDLRLYEVDAIGSTLRSASDILSEVFSAGANFAVLPVGRLDPAFFQLRTGLAGEIMQKFVNYGIRLAIIGDISSLTAASEPLHDLVYEMNQGTDIWFIPTREQLETRLSF
jgi:hypothetical protein